jgi:hypothetical protein
MFNEVGEHPVRALTFKHAATGNNSDHIALLQLATLGKFKVCSCVPIVGVKGGTQT